VTPENPSDIPAMRISDADRDRAASVINEALAEGRLTPNEHSERIDAVFAARIEADLRPLVADLPGASAALAPLAAGGVAAREERARLVSVLSGIDRKGRWHVPARLDAVSVVGGIDLDLREAVLAGREITMRATCVVGGIDIVVPPEMRVVDHGWALLGGREMPPETAESARADAPVLRITGFSILGGISVRRKRRKNDKA
jgi:hypothetical protein